MKYEIVANSKPLALEKEVNARINDGWLPQGGLSISDGDKVTIYCQAMIKRNEVKVNQDNLQEVIKRTNRDIKEFISKYN